MKKWRCQTSLSNQNKASQNLCYSSHFFKECCFFLLLSSTWQKNWKNLLVMAHFTSNCALWYKSGRVTCLNEVWAKSNARPIKCWYWNPTSKTKGSFLFARQVYKSKSKSLSFFWYSQKHMVFDNKSWTHSTLKHVLWLDFRAF